MHICFIDTVHRVLWDRLAADGHACVDATALSKQEMMARMQGVDGIVIRSRFLIDKEFIDSSPDLKFIARSGAGMENIDTAYAAERGIHCINSPEGNRDAVAEHAVAMLLMLFNKLHVADREVRGGQWNREKNRGIELKGKTVGIIGYGRMGSAFAARLSGFGCDILAFDKYLDRLPDGNARQVSRDELLDRSDIVSLHVPLTEETAYLVDERFFSLLPKPIWLINTARGKCVNLGDLSKALAAGKVLGACLDVLEYEDLSFERFSIQDAAFSVSEEWRSLVTDDRIVFSPHIAGWTVESYRKLSEVLYAKISEIFPVRDKF
jgi:D-3-phosphoglycerate dehydrogenase